MMRGMSSNRMKLGAVGEDIAAAELEAAGMEILDRNWRCCEGEIDIVARDGDVVVICEVKTRRGLGFGAPLESITHEKLARLRRLAVMWAQERHCRLPLRIDAIGILLPGPVITHERGVEL